MKCGNCPFLNTDEVCPRWPTNHTRYCQWVDPTDPAYRPDGREVIKKIASRKDGSFPPLVEQAKNFVGAVGNFIASGLELADESLQNQRKSICETCENFVDKRCRLCGCSLPAKIIMKSEHCPIDKW